MTERPPEQSPPTVTLRLDPVPTAASAARRHVRRLLAEWGREDLEESATLAASELVTNATLHARTAIAVRLHPLPDGGVRLEVDDDSPVLPQVKGYTATSTVGRGLTMLDALGRWGVVRRDAGAAGQDGGKTIWCEIGPGEEPGPGTAHPVTDEPGARTAVSPVLGHYLEARRPGDELVTVHLLRFPLQLFATGREHHDELLREFALMALVPADPDRRPVPHRLVELVDTLGSRYRASAQRDDAVRDAALARGDLQVDLTYRLPASASGAVQELDRLMDEADVFCRAEQLLTLAETPLMRDFRKWFNGQFVTQLAGEPPVAWPGPLFAGRPGARRHRAG